MKKLLLIVCIILLCGCSKDRTLRCVGKINEFTSTVNIVYDTKKMNIKSASAEFDISLDSYSKEEVGKLKDYDMCSALNKYSLESCKTISKDNKIIIKTILNASKLNKEDFNNKKVKFEKVKEKFEKELNGKCE